MNASRMMLCLLLAVPTVAFCNQYHDVFAKMPEVQRNQAFAKFMQLSGEGCKRVSRSFFRGFDKTGAAYWAITCDGKSWQVALYNDTEGSSKLLECSIVSKLKDNCFKKFNPNDSGELTRRR
jgi:hypothetical protein